MKLHHTLLASCLLALISTSALAADPHRDGALRVPANRIAGVWSNLAMMGPCGGTPGGQLRQTIVFHAGGTFLDNSPFPPGGMPNVNGVIGLNQRSIGLGAWSYNPLTGQYYLKQRFDWFVNNQYHGYQVVERTNTLLSNDDKTLTSGVHTVRYAANGAVIVELCGSAVSQRL